MTCNRAADTWPSLHLEAGNTISLRSLHQCTSQPGNSEQSAAHVVGSTSTLSAGSDGRPVGLRRLRRPAVSVVGQWIVQCRRGRGRRRRVGSDDRGLPGEVARSPSSRLRRRRRRSPATSRRRAAGWRLEWLPLPSSTAAHRSQLAADTANTVDNTVRPSSNIPAP